MEPMYSFALRTAGGEVIPTDADAPVTITLEPGSACARATITVFVDVVEGALIAVPPEPLPAEPARDVVTNRHRGSLAADMAALREHGDGQGVA